MNYHLTLINDSGFMLEYTLDLPVDPEITWKDFEGLSQVKNLLLLNPTMKILDVTPEGMPDRFTDEQQMLNQFHNMGIKRSRNEKGVSVYEETTEVDLDLTDAVDIDSLSERSEIL